MTTNGYQQSVIDRIADLLSVKRLTARDRKYVIEELKVDGYEWTHSVDEAAEKLAGEIETRRLRRTHQTDEGVNAPWVWALSTLYASIADADSRVIALREELLGGDLLEWAELENWITAKRQSDLPLAAHRDPSGGFRQALVTYAVPGDRSTRSLPIGDDSDLHRLQLLADKLAKPTDWHPAAATTWLLTGVTPAVSPLRVNLRTRSDTSFGARPRIDLSVDPDMTPKEVARVYSTVRRAAFGGRRRSLGRRTLQIVESAMSASPSASMSERHRQWNRDNENDRIADLRTFRKYVNRGVSHLVNTRATVQTENET